jgi:SAM-dependent methyltransferase
MVMLETLKLSIRFTPTGFLPKNSWPIGINFFIGTRPRWRCGIAKIYLKKLLEEQEQSDYSHLPAVLNVGCGPCRDIYEYLQEKTATNIRFECLDIDKRAINYSKSILKNSSVECCCKNAFRLKPDKKYDLVWSAGLFDYLQDKQFIFLFRLLLDTVAPDGEIVVGNFSEENPSRDYMEFGEWFLHHRTEDKLAILAEQAGCSATSITIEKEPAGVNLFLRFRKS